MRAPIAEAPSTPPPPQAPPSPPAAATDRPGAPTPLRTPPPRAPQVIDPPLPAADGAGRGGGALLLAAWAASVAAVVGMLVALWVYRVEVVAAWPPAARLFDVLGG
jgi:hypothetical protein